MISEILISPEIQSGFLIVLNLIVIESLLSVDNAAVLATMVMDLPKEQRKKALHYGILGAYIFRGLCLLFAYWLVQVWWLKPLGGLYLIYLCYDYFKTKKTPETSDDTLNKEENKIYKYTKGKLNPFWATVILVELMDLAFSIDNVFAAIAFTDNIYLIWTGVFIGILAMRFVAQGFVQLMSKFPFLNSVAFIVIGVLGVKLTLSVYAHYFPHSIFSEVLEGELADLYISIFTIGIFVFPVISCLLFNYPERAKKTI